MLNIALNECLLISMNLFIFSHKYEAKPYPLLTILYPISELTPTGSLQAQLSKVRNLISSPEGLSLHQRGHALSMSLQD